MQFAMLWPNLCHNINLKSCFKFKFMGTMTKQTKYEHIEQCATRKTTSLNINLVLAKMKLTCWLFYIKDN